MYLIHKRTSETSFIIRFLRMYHMRMFSLSTGLAPDSNDYIRFLVRLWLTYCSLTTDYCELVWSGEPVHLGEPVRIHITVFFKEEFTILAS